MKSRGKRENTPLLDYGVTNETGKAQKAEIVALAANPAGKCESRNYRQIPLGAGSLASGMGTRLPNSCRFRSCALMKSGYALVS